MKIIYYYIKVTSVLFNSVPTRIHAFGIEVRQMEYLDVRGISGVPQEQEYLCH